ncbi:MAG: helix-hairpin-helix domain-containing protein [Candidatus Hydrogenedentales bacterium]|jgi:competence protein ComEA
MFAPNRLLSVKEQWLIIGLTTAILIGVVTVYFINERDHKQSDEAFVTNEQPAKSLPLLHEKPVSALPEKTTKTAAVTPLSPPAAKPPENVAPQTLPPPNEEPQTTPAPKLGVAVMGAVKNPGLYWLHADARLVDLIEMAGGATEWADLSTLALSAPVIDESTLTVPKRTVLIQEGNSLRARRGREEKVFNPPQYLKHYHMARLGVPASAPPVSNAGQPRTAQQNAASTKGGSINLNLATQAQLEELPGIGVVLAGAIIAERERQPFASVDDLRRVPGIGEKRLNTIRALVSAP